MISTGSTPQRQGWSDATNTRRYARFARDHPWYGDLAEDLVGRTEISEARLVIDLCAGAGAVTGRLLPHLPSHARVLAIDASAAMIAEGRRAISDERVEWLHAPAESVQRCVTGPADAVLCSASFWETDMPSVLGGLHAILRPGGRFVFNLSPSGVVIPSQSPTAPGRAVPALWQRIFEHAQRAFGYAPPSAAPVRRPDGWPFYASMLAGNGFSVQNATVLRYEMSTAQMYEWLSIPMFLPVLPGLTPDQVRHALDAAYRDLDPEHPMRMPWLLVTAIKPPESTCDHEKCMQG